MDRWSHFPQFADVRRFVSLAVMALLFSRTVLVSQEADEEENGSNGKDLPLEVDRWVPMDMTEGSWISLDVSPDGQTIVFDYLGDLFTMPITGGAATQLTSGLPFDAQPRFSPDGTQIVYISDQDGGQNVWIMSVDGSDAQGPSL